MLSLKHANHLDLMWHAVVNQAQELIEKRVPSSTEVHYVCAFIIDVPLFRHMFKLHFFEEAIWEKEFFPITESY